LIFVFILVFHYFVFSRPYLSNGRAIVMVVDYPSVCPSVTDVLWLSFNTYGKNLHK